ncbi:M28 family peptidase [Paenimyroides aestuarii]|uniref:M20/M25/M40 family metallo-hydrolase n=1 Tax=Paenimyroides aestuarii TaxID=2968490 RepID=A0ABY5NNP9_9FLAO|nr:M28 family peptidase [Paenimyroides aestuarii]UUV20182.1 M20/M25/M40 family metallo-hydrolase [Paenimyroides aestuarii]
MKKILLFTALSLSLVACKSNQKAPGSAYQVKEADVVATLKYLTSDELEGRDSNSEGILKAANYLEEILEKSVIKPYFSTYKDTLSNYDNSFNVVGYIEGNDPKLKNEFVILGAHYDHIGITEKGFEGDYINNGANDNASGTTVLSEVAKYLAASKNCKRSVLIVFFSAEEKGLLGSKHLAKKLKKQNMNIYSMLNFEMVGVPMSYDFKLFLTGYTKSNMAAKLNEYASSMIVGMSDGAEQYNLFAASDNYPFYEEFKIPAHTVSAFDFSNFNYYHHPKDEFQAMDTAFMTTIAQDMLPVVSKMINAETREIKMN